MPCQNQDPQLHHLAGPIPPPSCLQLALSIPAEHPCAEMGASLLFRLDVEQLHGLGLMHTPPSWITRCGRVPRLVDLVRSDNKGSFCWQNPLLVDSGSSSASPFSVSANRGSDVCLNPHGGLCTGCPLPALPLCQGRGGTKS